MTQEQKQQLIITLEQVIAARKKAMPLHHDKYGETSEHERFLAQLKNS